MRKVATANPLNVALQEKPAGVKRARVRVTFLPESERTGEEARQAARQRAFARMKTGIDFGGEKFDRDELYEDRLRRRRRVE